MVLHHYTPYAFAPVPHTDFVRTASSASRSLLAPPKLPEAVNWRWDVKQ